MKAVVCHEKRLRVVERDPPLPGPAQVLLEVLRCGICGSDLHAQHHGDHWEATMQRSGYRHFMRSDQAVVFGHEFCGTVLDHGPGCRKKVRPGTRVVALPILQHGAEKDFIGFSGRATGAYAEQVLAQEALALPVPNGLPTDIAALNEPMAIAWHGVRRSGIRQDDVAIVIGCGPVGLATICLLKSMGVRRIVASNSSPARRELASRCGAHVLVNPSEESPFARSREFGHLPGLSDAFDMAFDALERLERLPVPWWHAWNMAEKLGRATPKRPVIFECVGLPGVIEMIVEGAPMYSRVVVLGVCMETDRFEPALAINKEIELRFVFGYTPLEFRETLHMMAEGKVNAAPLLTGKVGLDGVQAAFDAIGRSKSHAKILIDPASTAREPVLLAAAA